MPRFRFAGDLGQLQDKAGEALTLELIVKFAADYSALNAELNTALPHGNAYVDPADFEQDFAGYQAANAQVVDLLRLEVQLRRSVLARKGRKATQDVLNDPPLVGRDGRLISFLNPAPKEDYLLRKEDVSSAARSAGPMPPMPPAPPA